MLFIRSVRLEGAPELFITTFLLFATSSKNRAHINLQLSGCMLTKELSSQLFLTQSCYTLTLVTLSQLNLPKGVFIIFSGVYCNQKHQNDRCRKSNLRNVSLFSCSQILIDRIKPIPSKLSGIFMFSGSLPPVNILKTTLSI